MKQAPSSKWFASLLANRFNWISSNERFIHESNIPALCMTAQRRAGGPRRTGTALHLPHFFCQLITSIHTERKSGVYFEVLAIIGWQRSLSEDSSRGTEWKRRLKGRPACLRPGMGVRYPGQQHPRTRTAWTRVNNNLSLVRNTS